MLTTKTHFRPKFIHNRQVLKKCLKISAPEDQENYTLSRTQVNRQSALKQSDASRCSRKYKFEKGF